ncbi:transcriptional regulatory protein YycF [bacterium BMS3Abin04]|nr:transcriptional regulatory protein YycF [bacterium BMS3Abin04]
MKTKILLVDDEKDIVEFLQYNLEQEGFEVFSAFDGEMALAKMTNNPDLIVLDIMMPKMNGYEVCKKVRSNKNYDDIPIIFLTAKTSELDELKGFDLGADDYIKKPISPKMLVARVKSKLKKNKTSQSGIKQKETKLKLGPIEIDRERFTVTVDGEIIAFPKKEFEILHFLISNKGKVFPRDVLLNEIWGLNVYVVDRTVDVHVRKIREKLGKYSTLIQTVKGVGYRFKDVE